MRYATRLAGALATLSIIASCGSVDRLSNNGPSNASDKPTPELHNGVVDYPVKIGEPFKVGSTEYTPVDTASYDEVGFASYYGAELIGRPTANGETFAPSGISAAHQTLPLPSYVEVTALDTGRTILVRVNDRGPFANGRLIDLSEGAAKQLGVTKQGVAGVRVRRVNPPEQERAVLRAGMRAAERIDTPDSLLRILRGNLAKLPKPSEYVPNKVVVPVEVAAPAAADLGKAIRERGIAKPPVIAKPKPPSPKKQTDTRQYVVQVAALSSRSNADQVALKLGANVVATADGKLFRIRFGPYRTESEGKTGLATAKQKGYPQARLYRE